MSDPTYLSGATQLLKWSLLYPSDFSKIALWKKLLYFIWRIFYVLSFITIFIQCVVYLYQTPFDLIEEAMIIMNTVIYFSLFVNFLLLHAKTKSLVNFVENINKNFIYRTDNNMEEITMKKASQLSDKVAYYWTISCIVSSLMPTILSLVLGTRSLPIVAWFPYDYEKSPYFEMSYIWEVFCLTTLGMIYAVMDFIFPCITILMGQQFKILACNFKNTIYKTLLELKVPKHYVKEFSEKFNSNSKGENLLSLIKSNEDIFNLINSKEFDEVNTNYMKKNIKHHQLLLNYCNDINYVLSTFLMGKIFAAIFNTLFMAFNLITTGNEALMAGLITYVLSTSTELFIYTYSGQILTENSNFLPALYEYPWYLCDLKFQKLFNIVQMRTNKTVYIRAGNYFSLYAPSFIMFMKALFSYVAVLKELTDRGK